MFVKRIDKTTREYRFVDQNENIILSLQCYFPQPKDRFGRYIEDSRQCEIVEGIFFVVFACERHDNHLALL